jgi:Nucleoside 2-deoxyribosyltransferase
MNSPLNIYFAGELFDHKHLIGNALLADAINKVGEGRWQVVLPQDNEAPVERALDIRDQDFKLLLGCDVAVFHFDGLELDSGTVAEFMMAKMIDLPCVIMRSDIRAGGDQKDGEPWNLMCSGYPRTETLIFNAIEMYKKSLQENDPQAAVAAMCQQIAEILLEKLEKVSALPSLFKNRDEMKKTIYNWAAEFPGGNLVNILPSNKSQGADQ